jgi:hypothetical protein
MPASRFATALLLICLCISAAAGADDSKNVEFSAPRVFSFSPPRVFSFAEYVAELDRLAEFAKHTDADSDSAASGIAELLGGWKLQSDGRVFEIPTSTLFDQFEKLQRHPDAEGRDRLLESIAAMKADAQAFQQSPDASSSGARATLTQILARREFHQVHGPTWLDRLKIKILSWIVHLLTVTFGSSAAPVVGKIFVWGVVVVAVLALAWFIYREMKRNARLETIMPEVLPVSAKQWRIWLAEAQAAAARGLWRDAVHLAYWGGISFLEESGMWRPDQARTPREYLRLLPADSQHRAALSTLTRQLEVTWYGNQQAGPETFSQTLTHLEELGCRQR